MKHRKISLTIPNPCSEPWSAMDQKSNGRFCRKCTKVVVDLSRSTPQEIHELIADRGENICARLRLEQLHTSLTPLPRSSNFAATAFFAGLIATMSPEGAHAVSSLTSLTEVVSLDITQGVPANTSVSNSSKDTLFREIQGKVITASLMEPVIGAVIRVVGTTYACKSDYDGEFSLRIPSDYSEDSLSIHISGINFTAQEFVISLNNLSQTPMILTVEEPEFIIGELIVIDSKRAKRKAKKYARRSQHN